MKEKILREDDVSIGGSVIGSSNKKRLAAIIKRNIFSAHHFLHNFNVILMSNFITAEFCIILIETIEYEILL